METNGFQEIFAQGQSLIALQMNTMERSWGKKSDPILLMPKERGYAIVYCVGAGQDWLSSMRMLKRNDEQQHHNGEKTNLLKPVESQAQVEKKKRYKQCHRVRSIWSSLWCIPLNFKQCVKDNWSSYDHKLITSRSDYHQQQSFGSVWGCVF